VGFAQARELFGNLQFEGFAQLRKLLVVALLELCVQAVVLCLTQIFDAVGGALEGGDLPLECGLPVSLVLGRSPNVTERGYRRLGT
jgi:hypothetical protein